ncbi:MAG: hypothetical protein ACE5ID_09615, partial [Acidobacteriota bacterium]
MRSPIRRWREGTILMLAVLAPAMAAGAASSGPATAEEEAGLLVVKGEKVFTMAGDPIENGVILARHGKIVSVGRARDLSIPAGAHILSAAVVIPGLIDAHTVLGLSGYLNQTEDQDQLERSSPMQPELRALDAYNPRDRLVEWVRSFGITTIHTGHSPGRLISGQTMITKTWGNTVEEAVLVPTAMVAASLGQGAIPRQNKEQKSPGTRAKAVAMLRGELLKARAYREKRQAKDPDRRPDMDLRLEALARVLEGRWPLLVTVQRHQDILAALRVAREFGIRMILDGAAEAGLVMDAIKAAHVAVIVHPTMTRAFGETENLSMETAGKLAAAGIPLALESGY